MTTAAMPWMMTPSDFQSLWSDFWTKTAYLPKAMEVARKVRVGATPTDTVLRIDKARLQHYVSPNAPQFQTPTLVVFALVNRPYILDLRPGKSVVALLSLMKMSLRVKKYLKLISLSFSFR